jgi:hypothetical protein
MCASRCNVRTRKGISQVFGCWLAWLVEDAEDLEQCLQMEQGSSEVETLGLDARRGVDQPSRITGMTALQCAEFADE